MSSPRRVVIGKVIKAFGIKGELRVRAYTESLDVFKSSPRLEIGGTFFEVLQVRAHKGDVLLSLAGVENPEEAKTLSGLLVRIDADSLPEREDEEYYWFELEGLRVVTSEGKELGVVHHLFATGANDVLEIHGAKGEILLPWIEDVVKKVDLAAGLLVVDPLEGLVPDD
jgi:16S rRNA processing protein RimM|uniref:Ribosome maturation factor RimM n=1 Tax=Desulfomonile tiedjei TaxID=2358 RepID=A0A7C4EUY4_9BACT